MSRKAVSAEHLVIFAHFEDLSFPSKPSNNLLDGLKYAFRAIDSHQGLCYSARQIFSLLFIPQCLQNILI